MRKDEYGFFKNPVVDFIVLVAIGVIIKLLFFN
jgi:hypothetical protein